MVPSEMFIGFREFLGGSLALRMASATSLALPKPRPTLPSRSPVTTRAEKLKRRPPFTTLAQRLMKTTFSVNCGPSDSSGDPRSSRRGPRPRPPRGPPELLLKSRRGGPAFCGALLVGEAIMGSGQLEFEAGL